MAHSTSSKITHGDLAADVVISAFSIRVDGILVSNNTGSADVVTFVDADGITALIITVPANASFSWEVSWMADNGLTAQTAITGVTVTVAHSADGA